MRGVADANSGYVGWSMSRRAMEARSNGEYPLSHWRKWVIIDEIELDIANYKQGEVKIDIEKLKKLPLEVLRKICLDYTGWHHTSKYFHETKFYQYTVYLPGITEELINTTLEEYEKEKKEKQKLQCDFCFAVATFKVFGGSFSRPKFAGYETLAGIFRVIGFIRHLCLIVVC